MIEPFVIPAKAGIQPSIPGNIIDDFAGLDHPPARMMTTVERIAP